MCIYFILSSFTVSTSVTCLIILLITGITSGITSRITSWRPGWWVWRRILVFYCMDIMFVFLLYEQDDSYLNTMFVWDIRTYIFFKNYMLGFILDDLHIYSIVNIWIFRGCSECVGKLDIILLWMCWEECTKQGKKIW